MRLMAFLVIVFTWSVSAQEVDSLVLDSGSYEYKSGDHELFLMPTAHTMPARQSYLGSYDVLLLNYTLAVGQSTHLGLYALALPDFDGVIAAVSVTLLAKHTYYESRTFSGAAWGMINVIGLFAVIGNIFSYETENIGFHGGFGFARISVFENRASSHGVFLLGTNAKICSWLHAIAEYGNTPNEMLDMDEQFNGLGMAGLRYRDRHFVLDIAAGKLFKVKNKDVFPIVKAVVYF